MLSGLHLVLVACANEPIAKPGTIVEIAPPSASASAPAGAAWAVWPKRLSYVVHYGSTDGAQRTERAEETAVEVPGRDGARLVTVTYTSEDAPRIAAAVTEFRVAAGGLFTLSEKLTYRDEVTLTHDYEPPRLDVPAALRDGATWQTTRYNGLPEANTLRLGSPFCAGGFHRVVAHEPPGGKNTKREHWCPGRGWRGTETYYVGSHGNERWSYTAEMRADGVALRDPPLAARLPEVPQLH